jgi:ketosteroid isomerase-like protein
MTGPTNDEIAALVRVTEDATNAFMQGDMERYLALTGHIAGFTLANPFGGPPKQYENRRPSLLAAAAYFREGKARIELVASHATADMLVLVMIEHQNGRVGGLPDQNWPLRVTQVYRREDGEWKIAHRHADPLHHAISLEKAAELARG